jgi:hypothetical protein
MILLVVFFFLDIQGNTKKRLLLDIRERLRFLIPASPVLTRKNDRPYPLIDLWICTNSNVDKVHAISGCGSSPDSGP